MQKITYWVTVFTVITIFTGLVYAAVQQDYRQTANDPQIQMAEDAAAQLSEGASIKSVIPAAKVDIARSLAPFVAVYDGNGKLLATNATENGQDISYPAGVFAYVKLYGEDRVTWQTQAGDRSATVVTSFSNKNQSGYVVAGRSLREVEKREAKLEQITALAWLVSILSVLFYGLMFGSGAAGRKHK